MSRSISPETYGGVPYATEPEAEHGSVDSTPAVNEAISEACAAGGGIIDCTAGIYRVTEGFRIPNSNTATVQGSQPTLRFQGAGGFTDAKSGRPTCGTGLLWTGDAGDAVAKIDTRGMGLLIFDNIILASAAGYGLTKPFVHSTFTCIQTGLGVAIVGGKGVDAPSMTYPDEDAFILGGTHPHETDGTDRRSPDCGFQGYGTDISNVFFAGVRRAALIQRYANSVNFDKNNIWRCGNLSATGGAIEVNGAPNNDGGYSWGFSAGDNLIEATCFRTGLHLKNTAAYTLSGNSLYDGWNYTESAVHIDPSCGPGIVDGAAMLPVGKPYLVDPSGHAFARGC